MPFASVVRGLEEKEIVEAVGNEERNNFSNNVISLAVLYLLISRIANWTYMS